MAVRVLCFIGGFFLLEFLIGSLFTYMHHYNINHGFHTKRMWDDFYAQEEYSLDLLFSGSSHAMESFDPEIFNERLNVKSFNLGTAAQKPETGYYILQQVLKNQQPKLVIFEAYWAVMGEDYYPKQAVENAEFIRDKALRRALLDDALNFRDKILFNFKSHWYRGEIATFWNLLKNGTASNPHRYYKKDGYVYSDTVFDTTELRYYLEKTGKITLEKLNTAKGSQVYYLKKSIELCQERGIEVLIVTAPLTPLYMSYVDNYDEIHDVIQQIADKYGVEYLDYNIINEREKLFDNENFRDRSHLNYSGVQILNGHLCEYLEQKGCF